MKTTIISKVEKVGPSSFVLPALIGSCCSCESGRAARSWYGMVDEEDGHPEIRILMEVAPTFGEKIANGERMLLERLRSWAGFESVEALRKATFNMTPFQWYSVRTFLKEFGTNDLKANGSISQCGRTERLANFDKVFRALLGTEGKSKYGNNVWTTALMGLSGGSCDQLNTKHSIANFVRDLDLPANVYLEVLQAIDAREGLAELMLRGKSVVRSLVSRTRLMKTMEKHPTTFPSLLALALELVASEKELGPEEGEREVGQELTPLSRCKSGTVYDRRMQTAVDFFFKYSMLFSPNAIRRDGNLWTEMVKTIFGIPDSAATPSMTKWLQGQVVPNPKVSKAEFTTYFSVLAILLNRPDLLDDDVVKQQMLERTVTELGPVLKTVLKSPDYSRNPTVKVIEKKFPSLYNDLTKNPDTLLALDGLKNVLLTAELGDLNRRARTSSGLLQLVSNWPTLVEYPKLCRAILSGKHGQLAAGETVRGRFLTTCDDDDTEKSRKRTINLQKLMYRPKLLQRLEDGIESFPWLLQHLLTIAHEPPSRLFTHIAIPESTLNERLFTRVPVVAEKIVSGDCGSTGSEPESVASPSQEGEGLHGATGQSVGRRMIDKIPEDCLLDHPLILAALGSQPKLWKTQILDVLLSKRAWGLLLFWEAEKYREGNNNSSRSFVEVIGTDKLFTVLSQNPSLCKYPQLALSITRMLRDDLGVPEGLELFLDSQNTQALMQRSSFLRRLDQGLVRFPNLLADYLQSIRPDFRNPNEGLEEMQRYQSAIHQLSRSKGDLLFDHPLLTIELFKLAHRRGSTDVLDSFPSGVVLTLLLEGEARMIADRPPYKNGDSKHLLTSILANDELLRDPSIARALQNQNIRNLILENPKSILALLELLAKRPEKLEELMVFPSLLEYLSRNDKHIEDLIRRPELLDENDLATAFGVDAETVLNSVSLNTMTSA